MECVHSLCSGNILPNYLLEGDIQFLLFHSLFPSFSIYVLGPILGFGDIVMIKIGKNPSHHKAYTLVGEMDNNNVVCWMVKYTELKSNTGKENEE